MSLKNDYDLLQEKSDKLMKNSNNLNQDLKDQIDKLNDELIKLKIFQSDSNDIIAKAAQASEKEKHAALAEKDKELNEIKEERDKFMHKFDDLEEDFSAKQKAYK